MFREMTRKNKALPREECIEILKKEPRGVLSVLGDDGLPYGMPMNHFYHEADGCLYFHCGRQRSHRSDALKRMPKVSYCVIGAPQAQENTWALRIKSVIVFGTVDIIDDWDTMVDTSARLSRKFTRDEDYIRREIDRSGKNTLLLRLKMDHISGKSIEEC